MLKSLSPLPALSVDHLPIILFTKGTDYFTSRFVQKQQISSYGTILCPDIAPKKQEKCCNVTKRKRSIKEIFPFKNIYTTFVLVKLIASDLNRTVKAVRSKASFLKKHRLEFWCNNSKTNKRTAHYAQTHKRRPYNGGMNNTRNFFLVLSFTGLTACGETISNKPIEGDVPGVSCPELALQKAMARVHNFLNELDGRVDTPVKDSLPLATAPLTSSSPSRPPTNISPVLPKSNEAQPLFGKNGYIWFVFSDGYPHIYCAIRTLCLIHLQANETLDQNNIVVPKQSHWSINALKQRKRHLELVSIKAGDGAKNTVVQLITSKRTYSLLLDPSGSSMRHIKFAYSKNGPALQPAPEIKTSKQSEHAVDYKYKIMGPSVSWSPIRVFQENNQTYFEFSKKGAAMAPQLTVTSPQLSSRQKYKTVGNAYIIDLPVNNAFLKFSPRNQTVIQIIHK